MSRIHYDLHLHSCLSPCGDDDMTPNNIVNMSLLNGMEMIALTDHNTCGNCRAAVEAGRRSGLCVVPGMELCTSEEIHVVCLFPTVETAEAFSSHVESCSMKIPNRPEIFGRQLLLNAEDTEVGEIGHILLNASGISISNVVETVRRYGGAAFPAHIDRDSYSVLSVLGEIPADAGFHAVEVSMAGDPVSLQSRHGILGDMLLLRDSDAHCLEHMPEAGFWIDLPECSPKCLLQALNIPFLSSGK